jgi:hypothetical protein
MRRVVATIAALGVAAFFASMLPQDVLGTDAPAKAGASVKAKTPARAPADRVLVMYFHRTQRCPTCLRMGSYSEEAVVKGFAKQIKNGTVEFHYVDFQDGKNAALTNGYKVGGPTLIVVKVVKNKAAAVKNLTEIWAKNGDKDEFLKYVQDNVAAYQKPAPKAALKPEADKSVQKAQ